MKTCSQCKETKDESEFSKDKSRRDGLNHRCKVCGRKNSSNRNTNNRDVKLEPLMEGFKVCNKCKERKHVKCFGTTKNTLDMRRSICLSCDMQTNKDRVTKRKEDKSYKHIECKICCGCKEIKNRSEYHEDLSAPDGLCAYCKKCKNEYSKKNSELRKEKFVVPKLTEKTCGGCGETKPASEFYIAKTNSTGLNARCKVCCLKYATEHRHLYNATKAKRRAAERNATPSWLTKEQLDEIKVIYKQSKAMSVGGVEYHVDHIVPLVSEIVCGLHVPWNLQILEASANISKNNRFDG